MVMDIAEGGVNITFFENWNVFISNIVDKVMWVGQYTSERCRRMF